MSANVSQRTGLLSIEADGAAVNTTVFSISDAMPEKLNGSEDPGFSISGCNEQSEARHGMTTDEEM